MRWRWRNVIRSLIYIIGFLIFIGWLFGDASDKEPDKATPQPIQPAVMPPDSEPRVELKVAPENADARQNNVVPAPVDPTWVYVTGTRVNVRDRPDLSGKRIATYSRPIRLVFVRERGDWLAIRHPTEHVLGWMHRDYLSFTKQAVKLQPPQAKPAIKKVVAPAPRFVLSDAQIRQEIVNRSISRYSGSCPCPFNTDRAGRRCGQRSAYSRPGGAAPICYTRDVTQQMIDRFR